MNMENELIEREYAHKLPFNQWQETDQYKELLLESKEMYPHVDDIIIAIYIGLWYKKEVLKETVEDVEDPKEPIIYESKQISIYDADEHLAKYGDVFKQKERPIDLIDEPEVSIEEEKEFNKPVEFFNECNKEYFEKLKEKDPDNIIIANIADIPFEGEGKGLEVNGYTLIQKKLQEE